MSDSTLVLDIPAKIQKDMIPIAAVLSGPYKEDVICFVPLSQAKQHHYTHNAEHAAGTRTLPDFFARGSTASAAHDPHATRSDKSKSSESVDDKQIIHALLQVLHAGTKRRRGASRYMEDEDESEEDDDMYARAVAASRPGKRESAKPAKKLSMQDEIAEFVSKRKPQQLDILMRYMNLPTVDLTPQGIRLDTSAEIVPCPSPSSRTILYIFGKSGAGKSTLAFKFAQQWQSLFDEAPIYMFSRLASDKSIDGLTNLQRMPVDESIVGEAINSDDFAKNSLVIFDDCDTLPDKQKQSVQKIRDDLLETGRHRNISVVVTSHLGSNGADTRRVFNECHYIITFPQGVGPKAFNYVLTEYGGLRPDVVDRLRIIPSRWIGLRLHYPPAVLHQRGVLAMQHPFLL